MSIEIQSAVARLNSQLPLFERQQALPAEVVGIHRGILESLARRGRPLSREEIAEQLSDNDVDAALERLGADDLVVLAEGGAEAVGAYPMSVEDTPHRLTVDGVPVNAMCALDALSVGPMYDADVQIESRCHISGEPIRIHQKGDVIVEARPSPEVRVGVRWQNPTACAAHSMCLEMVFLKDGPTALGWQDGDTENISVFTLDEAVAFGAGFFKPLL